VFIWTTTEAVEETNTLVIPHICPLIKIITPALLTGSVWKKTLA
jgi:hypothetical protein